MSTRWHYQRNGKTFGPVTSQQLKQLAVTGQLLRVDLIQKEGMTKWTPANHVKGLFDEPEPPRPSSVTLGTEPISESAHQPKAVPTSIWEILKAKARGVGLTVADRLTAGADGSGAIGNRQVPLNRKSLKIAALAGCGCFVLVLAAAGIVVLGGNLFSLRSGKNPDKGQFLASFDDHPPPIKRSLTDGRQIWLLDDYHSHTTYSEEQKEALYVVLANGELEYVVLKTHWHRRWAKIYYQKDKETLSLSPDAKARVTTPVPAAISSM